MPALRGASSCIRSGYGACQLRILQQGASIAAFSKALMMAQPKPVITGIPAETLWKTLQTFNITRVVIAVVLLAYLIFSPKKDFWGEETFLYQEICIFYLVLAALCVMAARYYRRRLLMQVVFEIAVDIVFISIFYIGASGMRGGLAILYLFPLAGGAILAPLLVALFFVSTVTLILLTESAFRLMNSTDTASISQAGLYGAAFFAAAIVINRLAVRLINQEKLALQRGRDLQVQLAINQLIIADMGDGILVVDRDANILIANPAAKGLLGLSDEEDAAGYKLNQTPHLIPIARAFSAWMKNIKEGKQKEDLSPVFVVVKPSRVLTLQNATTIHRGTRRDLAVHLRLQFAKVEAESLEQDRAIIFMQDVSEIENQAQQLKLASMGRLTASIAHEVRNPLSAISYANGLLSEEATDPSHKRLLNIVNDNVARLNRMVEDILKLSRKAQMQNEPMALFPLFAEIIEEFQASHSIKKGIIQVTGIKPYRIWFDPLHLREVVVNLLSNAVRYASGKDNSIRLHFLPSAANRLELHVQDDGPGISQEVRAHLFEPFYTTSSKGTGLGLYLARELCLNNDAVLDYEYRREPFATPLEEASGRFVITFAMQASL